MRACYHSTTKRLERSGAKAGAVLSGVAAHNQGLRVKLLQDQPSGGLGPIEGPFEILDVQLRTTNAVRYGDEITRRVQSVLVELEACPETRALAPDFHAGLKRLHEELGVPALALKLPKPAPRAKAPRTKAPPRTKA